MKLPHNQGTFTLTSLQHFCQKGLILCLPFIPHLPAEDKEMTSLKNTGARPTWPLPLDDRKINRRKKSLDIAPITILSLFYSEKTPHKNRLQFLAWLVFSFHWLLFVFSFLRMTYHSGTYDNWSIVKGFWVITCVMVWQVYWLVKMGIVFLKLTFWLLCHPRL